MTASLYGLVLGVLATWRVTHLLQAEDGPADLVVRLRRAVGEGFLGSLLDCFYCLSLWIAAPFALFLGATWPERAMLWLAFSGGASLLERRGPGIPAAIHFEDKEETDVLLRQQASAVVPSGESGSTAPTAPAAPGSARPAEPSEPDPGADDP
jgi:hypothetical protein